MTEVAPHTFQIGSYLVRKRKSILILKWLGYFPIKNNPQLTDFRMTFGSCSVILQFVRALVILALFTCETVLSTHSILEKYQPLEANNKTQTNNTNNTATTYKVFRKYNFSSLVDYFRLIQLLLYVLILTAVCKNVAKFLTRLCNSVNVLDEELGTIIPNTKWTFWKLYAGLFFQLLGFAILQASGLIVGILYADSDGWVVIIICTIEVATYCWLHLTMSLYELIFTISIKTVVDRLKSEQLITRKSTKQQVILQQMVEVLNDFKTTFGGMLTLNLSFYTLDCMTETFSAVIFVSTKDFLLASIYALSITGSLFKIYNIASGCELLTTEVEDYVEYLDECDTKNEGHASGRRVSN